MERRSPAYTTHQILRQIQWVMCNLYEALLLYRVHLLFTVLQLLKPYRFAVFTDCSVVQHIIKLYRCRWAVFIDCSFCYKSSSTVNFVTTHHQYFPLCSVHKLLCCISSSLTTMQRSWTVHCVAEFDRVLVVLQLITKPYCWAVFDRVLVVLQLITKPYC